MKRSKNIMQQVMRPMGLMRPIGLMRPTGLMRLMVLFFLFNVQCSMFNVFAQTIGGNVYGGGNKGDVKGNARVTVKAGNIQKVFGGARMADIGGNVYTNIDGEDASGDIFITDVYGGNDISGNIGTSTVPLKTAEYTTGLTDILTGDETKKTAPLKNEIDDSWNAFVRTSRSTEMSGENEIEKFSVIIGSLFGGGNGDYFYKKIAEDDYRIYFSEAAYDENIDNYIAKSTTDFNVPNLAKTYLEIKGGCIAHLYGGGNDATITDNTTISINNESDDLGVLINLYAQYLYNQEKAKNPDTDKTVDYYKAYTFNYLKDRVGLTSFQSTITDFRYNFARVFGGNNRADMAIQPTWNLQRGKIRDLYSGGNQGRMTHPNGLLLNIEPEPDETTHKTDHLVIDNVYGGCRMADVRPLNPDGTDVDKIDNTGTYFPPNMAARVLVNGGDINNVYGGNDIRGRVYFGNVVGISTSIRGNVYGGGNGAYAYTDNNDLAENINYKDYFYDQGDYSTSTDALNGIRPDAEQVSLLIRGTDKDHPTIIGGSVFLGGNCATLDMSEGTRNRLTAGLTPEQKEKWKPTVELKIGSHVIADNVYLGNNGEGMKSKNTLKLYAGKVDANGNIAETGGTDYSSLILTDASVFYDYMQGASMGIIPTITFEDRSQGDRYSYEPYSSYIGSLFLGGNVGSMTYPGMNDMKFNTPLNIYNKVVGGCNSAQVPEQFDENDKKLNAFYDGGIIGAEGEQGLSNDDFYTDDHTATGKIKDRLTMNFNGLKIKPKRWRYAKDAAGNYITDDSGEYVKYINPTTQQPELEWNTVKWDVDRNDFILTDIVGDDDEDRRLYGGNIYGGCYNSGHINGNVIININESVIDTTQVFAKDRQLGFGQYEIAVPSTDEENYNSGVIKYNQAFDVMSLAMTTFGAGYGEDTEIWGSTTVNLNKGYTFQVFGGGQEGVVGKKNDDDEYEFNPAYSTNVNLNGENAGYDPKNLGPELPESEYLYGGGNEGDVCGNTYVNLGNGRIYDAFGGASDADILGHAELHIGQQPDSESATGFKSGFPWIKDVVYGGNDFGGEIKGGFEDSYDFSKRVQNYNDTKGLIYGYHTPGEGETDAPPYALRGAAYVEYLEGRVDSIFGGNYGSYDYDSEVYEDEEGNKPSPPHVRLATVNIRPNNKPNNFIRTVFGGSTGYPGFRESDKMQDGSYVLIDIPDGVTNFNSMEVFGGGSYGGVGMGLGTGTFTLDEGSAIIDLIHGSGATEEKDGKKNIITGIGNVYGGSYNEGITRRTVINVPAIKDADGKTIKSSNIKVGSIFGGAYGTKTLPPCDVYGSNVNYASGDACVTGSIYGGNNSERRTLYTHVNISAPVWSNKEKGYLATVYGAGQGENTWSEYTEVNLNDGAYVYQVYGGGEKGHVLNSQTVQKYMTEFYTAQGCESIDDPRWLDAWRIGDYFKLETSDDFNNYVNEPNVNLWSPYPELVKKAEVDDRDFSGFTTEEKNRRYRLFNTNVRINEGAVVEGYAYGGGLGVSSRPQSGDVWGDTYIALLGGVVKKNLYAAGSSGGVDDGFGLGAYNATSNPHGFTASANAYIGGGTARNVFGGGWEGHVGTEANPGETHVVVGKTNGTTFFDGIPAVERNAYAGGEGGSVYGTGNVTVNNGYIGYRYLGADSPYYYTYKDGSVTGDDKPVSDNLIVPTEQNPNPTIDECMVEKIDDETNIKDENGQKIWYGKESLKECGNVYGSGYDDISSVDYTNVNLYGGVVRCSVFGGGEISIVGRGTRASDTAAPVITKAGQTNVNIFNGHVMENVYGGGKGFNTLGYGFGAHNRHTPGMVFGQTRVNIHGGEIGTKEGVLSADEPGNVGNVFGGGDAGVVYSAYELGGTTYFGKKPEGSTRYDKEDEGYYYRYENGAFVKVNEEKVLTEDCKVVVEPYSLSDAELSFTGIKYVKGQKVADIDLKYLKTTDGTSSILAKIDADGKVTDDNGITFDRSYPAGSYVPTAALNTLGDRKTDNTWNNLDASGVIINNAVFAGGNIIRGSGMNANTTTVYGNATASIHDVYSRDLITLGLGEVGGLYGDGNLTLVDGYRELNITNYGTDYYHIYDPNNKTIPIDTYDALPAREKEFYKVKYVCAKKCTDNEGTEYEVGSTLSKDELLARFLYVDNNVVKSRTITENNIEIAVLNYNEDTKEWESNQTVWDKLGEATIYAGRVLNTLQRADFCGVWGSRMIMKGAYDRVLTEPDGIKYTINRVREVSLNKKSAHGNYFGIHSNVNYLGALTSDLDFYNDLRHTDNTESKYRADANNKAYETTGASFANWKSAFPQDDRRNNGISHNQVALASGVCLQLTSEEKPGKGYTDLDNTEWGLITGVVELDLINVSTGIGGGYVYAKNIHGVRNTVENPKQPTLTALNHGAATYKKWEYVETNNSVTNKNQEEWETSGNFVHGTKTILDDCYNISGRYKLDKSPVPAHYWYISGKVYLYDQYIAAYTGSTNAYSEAADIPLTIASNSNGKIKLISVKPNLYAYYSYSPSTGTKTKLTAESEVAINNVTYKLNDPISYWDWSQLPDAEQELFVKDTYVTIAECKTTAGTTNYPAGTYPAGTVLTKEDYTELRNAHKPVVGDEILVTCNEKSVDFDEVFHSSNDISHDTGYGLTFQMTNPGKWDQWYTLKTSETHTKAQNKANDNTYEAGPTYYPTNAGLYGQLEYGLSDIIPEATYIKYEGYDENGNNTIDENEKGLKQKYSDAIAAAGKQASFETAYITTEYVETKNKNGREQHLQAGAKLAKSEYTDVQWAALTGKVTQAYVCTKTIQLAESEMIFAGSLMTATEKGNYKSNYSDKATDIDKYVVPAYYCTSDGLYGGNYYATTGNYSIQETLNSLSQTELDDAKFKFNYDALDLLIDPTYGGKEAMKYQYDGEGFTTATQAATNPAGYSLKQSVDCEATYTGETPLEYTAVDGTTKTASKGDVLKPSEYGSLLNEQQHYIPVKIRTDGNHYIVNNSFYYKRTYAAGEEIDEATYNKLKNDTEGINFKSYVDLINIPAGDYYYCRDSYTIAESTKGGKPVKAVVENGIIAKDRTFGSGNVVPVGVIITEGNSTVGEGASATTYYGYNSLTNNQKNFDIHGITPVETSTFYVTRNSDIKDLSKDKIITVVYQYNYDEKADEEGNVTPMSELHVVNIHLQFKDGKPILDEIKAPGIVLPGTSVTPKAPSMITGAYEIIGGGWELYEDENYAKNHMNGVEYTPSVEPLYWYQDGYYLAYYAKTYFGKTYSNYVPVAVANYHDIKEVMEDLEQHLHIDHTHVKRDPKIYINDYSDDAEGSKNGLDVFKSLYDLSLLHTGEPADAYAVTTDDEGLISSGTFEGHKPLASQVKAGDNLQFILHTDIEREMETVPNPEYNAETNPDVPETIDRIRPWTPIASGTNDPCFKGTFHGDGHLLSGLSNSLFSKLCGQVYNLGVTGSFTGGGIADTGDGYAENCWISTTGTPDAENTLAIIGNPGDSPAKQIENCYYLNTNSYAAGPARPMPAKAFYNGEVAYNLNGFYLHKRFYDNNSSWTGTKVYYKYWKPVNGTWPEGMSTGEYPDTYAYYPLDNKVQRKRGYVEQRFKDGDYRYVGENSGIIPTEADIRMTIVEETDPETGEKYDSTYFVPIWPDDYLFFGQRLNYGHVPGLTHQDHPSAIARSESRLAMGAEGNRVYRAPAYFRSKDMSTAYFNSNAVFAQSKNGDANVIAYKNMTAIDFSGGNGDVDGGYHLGLNDTKFYAPLLDDDGITGFHNIDLTKNLLVYTKADGATMGVVSAALTEPTYAELNNATTPASYRAVAQQDPGLVNGHWVAQDGTGYTASVDHFLVDKQDFNAPISYTFQPEPESEDDPPATHMWYQRTPDTYVEPEWSDDPTPVRSTKGWEGISLPFTADLVTTQDKGEITHFYDGSTSSDNNKYAKLGHEYWLREFTGIKEEGEKALADFNYPTSGSSDEDKSYTNTFLWDYYYQGNHDHKDANNDTYQTYYSTSHNYENYARQTAGKPYIIGFPSKTYYEFDLSGEFVARNTASSYPDQLEQQIITFASKAGATIGVSDDEMVGVTKDGYTFKTSYMNEELAVGTDNWALDNVGDSYDKVPASGDATSVVAFRPYFTVASSPTKEYRGDTRSIVFNRNAAEMYKQDEDISDRGDLAIYARGRDIYTVSNLKENINIRIINAAGAVLTTFTLEPGKTVVTPVTAPGTYLVNKKKLYIK